MRAYGYLQMSLLAGVSSFVIIFTALLNWLGSTYGSILSYFVAYYYNWLVFGLIGIVFGSIFGTVGAFGTYKNCRMEKDDPFSWPSEIEKRKAHEDTRLGFYCVTFTLGLIILVIIWDYFVSDDDWVTAATTIFNIVAILSWPVFVITVLTVLPPLLVDVICCNFLSRFLRKLGG